jgi:hypothetical protein
LPDVEEVFMSHSKNSHSHKDEKKQHKAFVSVPQTLNDELINPKQMDSSKTKSFDEIIKGFKEIEKIKHTDSDNDSQTENDHSVNTNKSGSSKSKSYAEIIKGFQEIEKIISNSQLPE